MNIAQSARDNTDAKADVTADETVVTTTIIINMKFSKLAADMKSGALAHQFNGKGRKIALLTEKQEPDYLSYSSDGKVIVPPFEINNHENITFILQAVDSGNNEVTSKWKGIMQDLFDLQLVPNTKSTYNANVAADAPPSETDEVTIKSHFKVNGEKFAVVWDPKVKIGKT